MENNNPMPQTAAQKAKLTAKDFFVYLGFIAALYTFIGSFISLKFALINTLFPDRQYNYFDPYGSDIRVAIATLIIATPLVIFLGRKIYSHIAADPAKKDLALRRWALYLTLFLSVLALAIDLSVLVYTFLGGEITMRFTLKALTVIAVALVIWWYTKRELNNTLALAPKKAKTLGWVVGALSLVLICTGFGFVGSPMLLRDIRDDNQRELDIDNLKYQVINYYQSKSGALPVKLEDINIGNPYAMELPKDPATEMAYEYEVRPSKMSTSTRMSVNGTMRPVQVAFPTFALCATFAQDGKVDERVQGNGRGMGGSVGRPMPAMDMSYSPFWPENVMTTDHPAGRHCFEVSIDPERYKPWNNDPVTTQAAEPMPANFKGVW